MPQDSDEYKLKVRELDLRESEISKSKLIEIVKIITTGVVVTLIPAIINYQIQAQEVEIKRLEGESKYLDKFSTHVVEQNDLIKRRNFVQYLAIVAHSKGSRERWSDYLKLVDNLAKKEENVNTEIVLSSNKKNESENKLAQINEELAKGTKEGRTDLSKIKKEREDEKNKLEKIKKEILFQIKTRDDIRRNSKLINSEPLDAQVQTLVLQMNSIDRVERITAVAKLIDGHKSNKIAISSSLDLLKLPQLETLSPSGRINVLVFLRNTDPLSWDSELRERAKTAINLIRNRSSEGKAAIGPQTEDALLKLDLFVNN